MIKDLYSAISHGSWRFTVKILLESEIYLKNLHQ